MSELLANWKQTLLAIVLLQAWVALLCHIAPRLVAQIDAAQMVRSRPAPAVRRVAHALVLVLTVALLWLPVSQHAWVVMAVAACGASLLALAWIDARTCLLPDGLTLPLLWAGLLVNLDGALTPLRDAVLGAAGGYLVLWCAAAAYRRLTGREGMGYGDFKLLAALGAWLGWTWLPALMLVSSACGVLAALLGRAMGWCRAGQALPFGPWLALAGIMALAWQG
ncbi:prepilin peptidase [Corticimicrobacter populi]|nr:A24 family peptidase [Corticimicrobacter populi]